MPNTWLNELYRFLWLGLIVAIPGIILGHLTLFLLIYTLAYLGWYLYYLSRLERLLRTGKKINLDSTSGLWSDVFNGIYRLRQRSRKRSKRLVKMLNRFRETISAMPDGIIVLREQGDIEWWNEQAETLLKLKYPQDVGQRMSNLIRHPGFTEYMNGKLDTPDVTIPSRFNDQVLLNIRIIPYGKDQKLLLLRDVTVMKQVEQTRRDFVANISHELRTPLTVLNGYIENLLEVSEDDEMLQRALNNMSQQSRRMQNLTEDLMLLTSLENTRSEVQGEVVNVAQMLTSLREQAEILSGDQKHKITLEADETICLRGNSKELDSIFTNLVVNAVNYTPEHGSINIRWFADKNGAHFEVRDTGIGIASHHIPRLTERFYRVDVGRSRTTGGSGLGLAIVKHALQQYNGNLRIESEIGRGSLFTCDFPAEVVVNKPDSNTEYNSNIVSIK